MLTVLSTGIQRLTHAAFGQLRSDKPQEKLIDEKVSLVGKILGYGMPNTTSIHQRSPTFSPLRFVWLASLLFGVRGQRTDPFPAQIELSKLDGNDGFFINGEQVDDYFGHSVSSAGDVNGDRIDDLLVGAYGADASSGTNSGKTYVIYGKATVGIGGTFDLSKLDGKNGFVINGATGDDESGRSVSSAGDVNDDGFLDILIGAQNASPSGRTQAGKTYVVFGKQGLGSSGSLDLSSLNGPNGFVILGESQSDESGNSVASAGDVNGDDVTDILIGARRASPSGRREAGKTYVVFGKTGLGSRGDIDLSRLNGQSGFTLNGDLTGDFCGSSVSNAGDINGDGVEDILIGAYNADNSGLFSTGKTYVVFGKQGLGSGGSLEVSSLKGTQGFVVIGQQEGDRLGIDVSNSGDVNGDRIKDFTVGAFMASPIGKDDAGKTYVVFGKAGIGSGGVIEVSKLNGNDGFVLNGDQENDRSGYSVSSAGDVNGDGINDMIIGAYYAAPSGIKRAGKTFVVFGKVGLGRGGIIELSNLNGMDGFVLNGDQAFDRSGFSVSSAGDVNGDGVSDLLIGATQAPPVGNSKAGKAYVVFGRKVPQPIVTTSAMLTSSLLSTSKPTSGTILASSTTLKPNNAPSTSLFTSSLMFASKPTSGTSGTILTRRTTFKTDNLPLTSNGQQQFSEVTSSQFSQASQVSLSHTFSTMRLNSDTQPLVLPLSISGGAIFCLSGIFISLCVFRKCKKPDQDTDQELKHIEPAAQTSNTYSNFLSIPDSSKYESGNFDSDDYVNIPTQKPIVNTYNAPPNTYSAPPNTYGAPPNTYGAPPNAYIDLQLTR